MLVRSPLLILIPRLTQLAFSALRVNSFLIPSPTAATTPLSVGSTSALLGKRTFSMTSTVTDVGKPSPPVDDATLPKAETGVLDLLQEYPQADGRGVTICVMDSGCDLAAAGLQLTSHGLPKYVDFFDCTGDNDIRMTEATTVVVPANHTITGVSGRSLILPVIPEGTTVRLACVRLFTLLPSGVTKRVQADRKKAFLLQHQEAVANITRKIQQLEDDASDNVTDRKLTVLLEGSSHDATNTTTTPWTKKEKKDQIKEYKVLLEELEKSLKAYKDAGPLMDLVMYSTANEDDAKKDWRVILDLQAQGGDLTNVCPPMAPFAKERQMGQLGFGSAMTFCIQVWEDGDVVSIVTDASSHGTHVAGIAAANFPTLPHKNGVAPGAQIFACKIGDGRLDSAETGTGLVRALVAAKTQYNCDLVNLSYGEPSWQMNRGRVSQTFDDAVYKWGMTVFTSAGNSGPALSTLGSPGSLSSPMTVGAFISPAMMKEQYSTLPPSKHSTDDAGLYGTSYYFSSRGPTPDGAFPDICAPGGAIAPVARHTLQGKNRYHGTSMSSPNACGVAAVVLSAMKQQHPNIKVGPMALRRALQNAAVPVDLLDPFAQGSGLLSAPQAFQYAAQHSNKPAQDLHIEVSIPSRRNARGLYLRDALELQGPQTFNVKVQPHFYHSLEKTPKELDELLDLELTLDLKASASWIQTPSCMTLLSCKERGSQTFSIRLNVEGLPPGAHFGTVSGVDASDSSRGPLFQLPVTVIVPHYDPNTPRLAGASTEEGTEEESAHAAMVVHLKPGMPERRFLSVPAMAEWATIKLKHNHPKDDDHDDSLGPHSIIVHAVPGARGDLPHTYTETKKLLKWTNREDKQETVTLKVKGGATMEVCLQLLWLANAAPTAVALEVEFHSFGALPASLVSHQPIMISPATEFARVEVTTPLRGELLNPSASLNAVHRTIRPKKQTISVGSSERDILPPSDAENEASSASPSGRQIYRSHIEYSFDMDGKEGMPVTLRIPSIFQQLYDSPLDAQIWRVEDSNGQILGYGSSMHEAASLTLSKGTYKLVLLLRHTDRKVLESVKDAPLRLSFSIKTALDCPIYYGQMDAASTPGVEGDDRVLAKKKRLEQGDHEDLYITRPTAKLPDWVKAGDICTGTLQLNKDTGQVTSTQLMYPVPPKPIESKETSDDNSEDESKEETEEEKLAKEVKEMEEALEKSIFESKLQHLKKLRSKKKMTKEYNLLADALKAEKPKDIPLLLELLAYAKEMPRANETGDGEKNLLSWRAEQISLVVDSWRVEGDPIIDEAALAQFFGCNMEDLSDDAAATAEEKKSAKEKKTNMEEQRSALRSGLLAKAVALANVVDEDPADKEAKSKLNDALKELKKWVSGPGDLKQDEDKDLLALALATQEIAKNRPATSLGILRKARDEQASNAKKAKEMIQATKSIYEDLGLKFWAQNVEDELFKHYPVTQRQME